MNVDEGGTRLCPTALCDPDREPTADRLSDLVSVSRELWWQNALTGAGRRQDAFSEGDILGDPHALRHRRRLRPVAAADDDAAARLPPRRVPPPGLALPADGQDYLENETSPGLWWDYTWGTQWAGDLARERHLLQVGAADRLLGDIVAKLKRIGAYDDTLLVVTADHGVAFGARAADPRPVPTSNRQQILWVPMFVKAPGPDRGDVDDRHAARSTCSRRSPTRSARASRGRSTAARSSAHRARRPRCASSTGATTR